MIMSNLEVMSHVVPLLLVLFLSYKYYCYIEDNALYRQSNRRYYGLQIVLDLAGEGWVLSNRTKEGWKIEKASKKFCEILGYGWISDTDNEVVGKIGATLASTDSQVVVRESYFRDKIISVNLIKCVKKDGKTIWCETSAQTVLFSDTGEKRISLIKNVEHIIAKFKDDPTNAA